MKPTSADQKEKSEGSSGLRTILSRLGMLLFGVLLAAGLVILLLKLFPGLIPTYLRGDRLDWRTPNQTLEIRITELDGDLYHSSSGQVRPPENPQTLAEFTAHWDQDGFRLPAVPAADYPILALGDSFTEGWLVEFPWPDVLAREIDTPVRNLGFLGWSIQQEAAVMRDYGTGEHQWILLAYFEGNDLNEIHQSYHHLEDQGNLDGLLERMRTSMFHPTVTTNPENDYKYPLELTIDGQTFLQGFHDSYLGRISAPYEVFANSFNTTVFKEGLGEIVDLSGDACIGLVFLPAKAHIYLQYATPKDRDRVLQASAKSVSLDEDGWLSYDSTGADFDTFFQGLGSQATLMQEIAQEFGIHYIDLTPPFQEAAARGEMLYYTYDSHWNQAGHDLAGQVIGRYLESVPDCEP